jgi:predicted DCC family thiol-disulfide oxidoreductase YuxK
MDPYYLIYDWDCELCVSLMKFLKQLDRKNMIVFLPFDEPFAKELGKNMREEDFQDNFHFVLPNGKIFSGDEAIPYVIGALPGGRIPRWILQHFPGKRFFLKAFYRWTLNVRNTSKE